MENKMIIWSEIYNNSNMAKEIGQEVISKIKKDNKVCTHNGAYHADDIFSAALIRICCGNSIEVIRTREPQVDIFTFDVGGGSFDHHQCDEYRDGEGRGIFASFGKLWCTLGRTIAGLREEAWSEIDREFVAPIDLTDNTGVMNPLNFWLNAQKTNGTPFCKVMEEATTMLRSIITAGLKKSQELEAFEEEVAKAPKGKVLHLSRFYQVNRDIYRNYEFAWITFPAGEDITIQAVGDELMPLEKRGLGPSGKVVFTHKGGFIGRAKDRETVLSLIQ